MNCLTIKIIKTYYNNGDGGWTAIFRTKFSSYVNKQNCRIGCSENSQVIEEKEENQKKSMFDERFSPKV